MPTEWQGRCDAVGRLGEKRRRAGAGRSELRIVVDFLFVGPLIAAFKQIVQIFFHGQTSYIDELIKVESLPIAPIRQCLD